MKTSRFSYTGDFARVANIGKVGKDFDEYSHYVILVGSPDYETSFLDSGEFIAAAAISRAFSRADEKGCAVSKQEVLRAADSVLGYYARNED